MKLFRLHLSFSNLIGPRLRLLIAWTSLTLLTATGRAQLYAPGQFDHIEITLETQDLDGLTVTHVTNSFNLNSPDATLQITDSSFPNGQSFGHSSIFPKFTGTLKFNFPPQTPPTDASTFLFNPLMSASMDLVGQWTQGSAGARAILFGIGSGLCSSPPAVDLDRSSGVPTPVSIHSECPKIGTLVLLNTTNPNVNIGYIAGGAKLDLLNTENARFALITAKVIYHAQLRAKIGLSPANVIFNYTTFQPAPAAEQVTLTNGGGMPLEYTATASTKSGGNWLKVSPVAGSVDSHSSTKLDLTIDTANLTAGAYQGSVTVSGEASTAPQSVTVTLNVTQGREKGILVVNPKAVNISGAPGFYQQELVISNPGSKALDWLSSSTTTSGGTWMLPQPRSGHVEPGGTNTATVLIAADLPFGVYQGTVTFTPSLAPGALDFPPVTLPVTLTVTPPNGLRIALESTNIFAGDSPEVHVEVVKEDGSTDTSVNGVVQVSLSTNSTKGIAFLRTDTQSGSTVKLALKNGVPQEKLVLQTPEKELNTSTTITPETVLEGKAILSAELQPALLHRTILQSPPLTQSTTVEVHSPLDLRINRIEAQQGVVQPPGETFVEGRDLLVRIFLDANTDQFNKYAAISGITVTLSVTDETGQSIGGYPLRLGQGAFANSNLPEEPFAFQGFPADTFTGADAINDVVPALHRQLTLQATLDSVYPDRNPNNNSQALGPLTFAKSKPTTILFSRARLDKGAAQTALPKFDGMRRAMEYLHQVYPVSEANFRFVAQPPDTLTNLPFNEPNFSEQWFWQNRARGADVKAWVYCVDDNFLRFFPLKGGVVAYGLTVKSVSVLNSDVCSGESIDFPCGIMAHELGHSSGLGDTYRSIVGIAGAINPRRPNATEANLVENGSFSWYAHRFADPSHVFFEFMGGGCPTEFYGCKWIDYVTWHYLKDQLSQPAPVGPQSLPPTSNGSILVVEGQVAKDGGGTLGPCFTLDAPQLASSSPGGQYTIDIVDAKSAVLSTLSFDPVFRAFDTDQELDLAPFSFALPFTAAARELRLRAGPTLLSKRPISAHAPAVNFVSNFTGQTLTGPKLVSWTGSDADGDAIIYSLYYSPDGQLQIPLLLRSAETNFLWNTDNSPSGPAPILTLVAIDGVRASTIDSQPFAIPNRPPEIVIASPADQARFSLGEAVQLEGSLFDPEEGSNSKAPLDWTSDLQSALGSGSRLVLTNLAAGTHVITAEGSDSQAARGTASVTITVGSNLAGRLQVLQSTLGFGNVPLGEARDFSLTVRNVGNAPLIVGAIDSSDSQFTAVDQIPLLMNPREQLPLTIRFTPKTVGDQIAVLAFHGADPTQILAQVSLLGTGTMQTLLKPSISQNKIVLSWSAAATDFVLESTPSLSLPLTWTRVSTPTNQIAGQITTSVSPSGNQYFYRLRKP